MPFLDRRGLGDRVGLAQLNLETALVMNKYRHLKTKAIELRLRGATLTEICERLALSKSTIYNWIKGLSLPRTVRQRQQSVRAAKANRQKYEAQRDRWYQQGAAEMEKLQANPCFRDFVVLYIAEGYKRDRNRVSICNANAGVMKLAHSIVLSFASNTKVRYRLQCHIDNDEEALRRHWAALLKVDTQTITIMRKSNAGKLKGRNWRSTYGVLMIEVDDTRFRCRLQAWMDRLQSEWMKNGA